MLNGTTSHRENRCRTALFIARQTSVALPRGESFNGSFRAECLNAHWFMSLDDARLKLEDWRRDYNEIRPHSAIGNKPPVAMHPGLSSQWPG